jgi:hypothetical protein
MLLLFFLVEVIKMTENMKYRYRYEGPVMEFDHLIALKWNGETVASSEKEAKNHLVYQFKAQNNRGKNARIILVGNVKKLNAVL